MVSNKLQLAAAILVSLCTSIATAQDYPVRAVRLVTIFAPGSASDVHARFLSQRTGIPAVQLPYTVGGSDRAKDLFGLFDDTIDRLLALPGAR